MYPELDFERVYASDMKKMIRWFGILKANDVELKLSDEGQPEESADEPVADAAVEPAAAEAIAEDEKPKKKAGKKQETL